MIPTMYVLDGHKPVPTSDIRAWAECMHDSERRCVSCDYVGAIMVNTTFLGANQNYSGVGDPRFFETKVFTQDGSLDHLTRQYATWEGAFAGHKCVVAKLKGEKPK